MDKPKIDPAVESPAPPMKLDEHGRCPCAGGAGRKARPYKRQNARVCMRCSRSFDYTTGEQQSNWAWQEQPDGQFARTRLGSV
jgi:hypothetical protein